MRCMQLGFSDTEGIADLHVSQFSSAHSFTFRESTKPKANSKIIRQFKRSKCAPSTTSLHGTGLHAQTL